MSSDPPRRKKTRTRTAEQRRAAVERRAHADPLSGESGQIKRSVISTSLTPEIAKLKKELAKLLIITIVRGYISQSSLQSEMEKFFGEVGKMSCFRGDSFVLSLDSEDEVIKACKMGEVELGSGCGRCWVTFSPWSGDIGSEGAARGTGTWVNLWNLPLHCWNWKIVAEVLKPIGELVSISKSSQVNKRYLGVLLRQRRKASLPHEVELNIGMRRYVVLITGGRDPWLVFRPELQRFVVEPQRLTSNLVVDVASRSSKATFTHDIPAASKGKGVQVARTRKNTVQVNVVEVLHSHVSRQDAGHGLPERALGESTAITKMTVLGTSNCSAVARHRTDGPSLGTSVPVHGNLGGTDVAVEKGLAHSSAGVSQPVRVIISGMEQLAQT